MRITSVVHKVRHVGVPKTGMHLFPNSAVRMVNASRRLNRFTHRTREMSTTTRRRSLREHRVGLGRFVVSHGSFFLNGGVGRDNVQSRCGYLIMNIRGRSDALVAPSVGMPFARKSIM